MPNYVLRVVYLALFQLVVQYGIIGWSGIAKTILTPLILLQKRIIKICLNKPLDYPTQFIYSECKVLNIDKIYKHTLLIHFHKNRMKFITDTHVHNRKSSSNLLT